MKTALPILAWFIFLVLAGKEFLLSHWEGALVVFAALSLIPPGLELLGFSQGWWYWPMATGFCSAYLLFSAKITPLLALPYLLLSVWMTIREASNLLVFRHYELKYWVRAAALAYWATGAVWAACFLAGITPLGFGPVIVGLTAAHFHVAGFVLTTVVYCLLDDVPTRINRALGWGSLLGMPLVAAGITLTKLGFSPVFEWVSALGFVVFALTVVWQHIQLSLQKNRRRAARLLWFCGSLCLVAGGALAALYALRYSLSIDWINIPNMKTWHGTVNAAGFGWLVLQGWGMVSEERSG